MSSEVLKDKKGLQRIDILLQKLFGTTVRKKNLLKCFKKIFKQRKVGTSFETEYAYNFLMRFLSSNTLEQCKCKLEQIIGM